MDQENWQKVEEIVDTVLKLDQSERQDYIEEACEGDQELMKSVTDFLKNIEQADTAKYLEEHDQYREFEADLAKSGDKSAGKSLVGKEIDAYKVTELISHGGMGSVYLAVRSDDLHDERVALKILPYGMDTPSNLDRFKRERKILAKLDHPNIARLLDGGVTEEGLSYLAMEYVDGMPIHEYCRQKRLSIEQRLKLFESVCRAIQYAHQNTVIHRDLKPSNILVTEDNTIKILDFGIAKLLEPEDPETSIFETRTGVRLFTLGYAAPEQIEGGTVTTATDTYELGVLLYELLVGVHPFDLEGKNLPEIEQLIRKQTPDRPSEKFDKLSPDQQNQVAHRSSTEVSTLVDQLEGDLDAIVMKTLRKEPEARYRSAGALLDDQDRRKKNLPLTAREDSWRYKAGKFLKRHKAALSVAAGFLLLIISFATFYTWQITEERNQVQQEAQKAKQISSFLVNIFQEGNPNVAETDTLTARQLLNRGLDKVGQLQNPRLKAEMLNILGKSYTGLGDYTTASKLLKKAINLSKQVDTKESRILQAKALFNLGTLKSNQQEFTTAVPYLREAYTIRSEELGEPHPETIRSLSNLGRYMRNTGKLDSAEFYTRKALSIQNENPSAYPDSLLLDTKHDLAYVLRKQTQYKEAELLYKEIISEMREKENVDQSKLLNIYNNLGYLYREQENYEKAESYYRKSLQISARIRGKAHPSTNIIRSNLANALALNHKLEEAEQLFKEEAELIKDKYSDNHWRSGRALVQVGYFLMLDRQQFNEAESYLSEGVAIYKKVLGSDHTWTAYAIGTLTAAEYMQGNYQLADSLFTIHRNIYEQKSDSLIKANKPSLKKLIRLYTLGKDTANKQYVNVYETLIERN